MSECRLIKKPVVPKYVADWYEDNKNQFEDNLFDLLWEHRDCSFENKLSAWLNHLPNKPIETLVNMHQFGYEIKKEKLMYTAKLKSTGEYLHYDTRTDKIHHLFQNDERAKKSGLYHFSEDELRKYNAWGNEAYEVNEVKE